jgi:PAS domain S-box-containing protein
VGYTEEELRALYFLDVTHEDYRQANWALITELLEGKRRQFQIEKKYRRKDGSSIWVSNNVSLVPGTERVPRFIMALSEDITQRKRAEEALQRSEGYLAEAQKLTHTGSWAWNVRSGALFWSREIFIIYDYEYQEMGPTWRQFLERVHPEDRPQIEQSARMEATGKEWLDSQNDFRIILPNGTIKHLHSVAHSVRDDSGEVIEVVGTMYRIFGLDPGPAPPSHMEVVRWLHPEDARYSTTVIEQAIRDRADFEADYRLILANGAAKYIHVVGHRTSFAGMRLGRISRIASGPRRACVTKTLRSGSKSIRHSCLRKLWTRHRPCKLCSRAL